MAKGCYSKGLTNGGANRGPSGGQGPRYSTGKDSSIAKGISSGRTGNTRIEVGYAAGKTGGGKANSNLQPDPKNRSAPFKQGGRA